MAFKVIIIGCGLAGALLGNGLMHANVDFEVYESDRADSKRDGYQIRLGAPALRGFKACLSEEQQAELYTKFGRSGGVISSAPILYDTQLNELLDLTKFPAYTKSAPINRVVLRDFLRASLDDAGKVKYEKKFAAFNIVKSPEVGRERIRVSFADGSTADGDLLISAEGSRSLLNKQIGLDNIVQLDAKWGFLAKGSLQPGILEGLDPLVKKSPLFMVKNGTSLFYSAYLPDARTAVGSKANSPERNYDLKAASLFWALQVPTEQCPTNTKSLEDPLGFCIKKISNWDPRIHDMLRATDSDDIYIFQARASTEPQRDWRSHVARDTEPTLGNEQVWLMGDAIHPMLPARGMGGNQALCDAADMLPKILRLKTKADERELTRADFVDAVEQYERAMIPRAFEWVKKSGGTNQKLREPTGVLGKIMFFFAARVLDVLHLFTLVRTALGYKPVDDAIELPD